MSRPTFNPDIPVNDSLIAAGELRDQFNSLNGQCFDLSLDVGDRSRKPSGVAPLDQTLSDPPALAEVQAIQDKLNELLAALNT
jgi:hypothetical protein